MNDDRQRENGTHGSNVNRRRILRAVGAGTLGTGLGGCINLSGGTREENAPNATYKPTDQHPLVGYDKTVKTGTGNVAGNEVEVEVTLDFFLYDRQDGEFGTGTLLLPQVRMAGIPVTSFGDKSIEEIMNDPGDRREILKAVQIDAEVAENQVNPQPLGTRPVPNGTLFADGDARVETWGMHGEEKSVLLDVAKGPIDWDTLEVDYDGEVTFATGTYRVYDGTPGDGGTLVGNPEKEGDVGGDDPEDGTGGIAGGPVIPEDDVETARDLHDDLMEEGLVILDDPGAHVRDDTRTTSASTTVSPTTEPPTTTETDFDREFEFPNFDDEVVRPKSVELDDAERSAAWDAVWNDETYQQVAEEARGLGFERDGFGLHRVEWNGSTSHLISTTFETPSEDYGYVFTPVERTGDGNYRMAGEPASILASGTGEGVEVRSIVPRTDAAPVILGLVASLSEFERMMGCPFGEWGLLCALKNFGLGVVDNDLTSKTLVREGGFLTRAVGEVHRKVSAGSQESWWECWIDCIDRKNGNVRDCLASCFGVCHPPTNPACVTCFLACGGVAWYDIISCAWECGVDM